MNRKKLVITRFIPLLIVLAVFAAVLTSSVFAYYIVYSEQLRNSLSSADPTTPEVSEGWTVEVEDEGYPVYVRAAIIVNWKNGDVVVGSTLTEGVDYELELNLDDGWKDVGVVGEDFFYFYYYTKPLSAETGLETSVFIKSCKALVEPPVEGYTLDVEFLVQTVQAVGETDETDDDDGTLKAWQDAWGLAPDFFD